MTIDVLVSSCARVDVLETSLYSFKNRINSKYNFKYILIEDNVEDTIRQEIGRRWIEKHSFLFDEIHYLNKKAGPGSFWVEAIKFCKSDYHFHLEDDNEFIVDINIDPLLDILQNNKDVAEIMLSRGEIPQAQTPIKKIIDDVILTEIDFFSVATGVFNTKLVSNMLDNLGWDKQPHEAGTLTPMSQKLKYRKFVLGYNETHYIHVGINKNYRKGSWRSE